MLVILSPLYLLQHNQREYGKVMTIHYCENTITNAIIYLKKVSDKGV